MRLRPEHLHPVHEMALFKTPKDLWLHIANEDGKDICYTDIYVIQYLPADHFKLYVRWGLVAKLVTSLSVRDLNVMIEVECEKQGVKRKDVPRLMEVTFVDPNKTWERIPQEKDIVGSGVSQSQVRRAMRMMLAPGSHTKQEWRQVMHRDGWKCLRCGSTKKLSKDHVVPISGGGTNAVDNLQTLCAPCNSWKGARHIDFRPQAEATSPS